MKGRSMWSWVALTLFVLLPLVFAANFAVEPQKVARGKAAALPLSDEMDSEQEFAQELALADERVQAYTTGQRTEVFNVQTISHQFNPTTVECNESDCRQVNIFNFDESATIATIVNIERGEVLDVLYQPGIRPAINKRLADLALEIATSAPEVIEVLGHQPVSSDWAPMDSTLVGSACETGHVCVAPTFDLGDYILWAIVDLTDEQFLELFWTSVSASEEDRAVAYPDAYQEKVVGCNATPGTHEQDGWAVEWETTAHDGFHVFNVTYNGVDVLTSAKLVEWHADYGNSGYQDSVGCTGGGGGFTIYPYGDTQILNILDEQNNTVGFELVQDFRMGNWGATCNYRYEQHLQFFNDGRYRVMAGSFGKGCGTNSLYRGLMRIDVAVNGDENDNLEIWDGENQNWAAQTTEYVFGAEHATSPEGYAWRISDDSGAAYNIEPARGQFEQDNAETDAEYFYAVQYQPGEGDGDLGIFGAGCCNDTNHGPEIYVDGDSIESENLVLWYIPQHQTIATDPDYTCWTVEGGGHPETYPCFGGPMFVPVGIEVDNGDDGVIAVGEEINFSAPPASPDASFLWDFGDGNSSTEQNPTHSYPDGGTYNIVLEVTEPDLRSAQGVTTYNMSITVLEAVSANFTHESEAVTGAEVQFTNSSTGDGTLSYTWDFGDGSTSTEISPTHAYADAGTYDVTLITANEFSMDTITSAITVIAAANANFTHDEMVATGADVAFTNTSTGGGTLSHLWDFGDGMTSTDEEPTHSYSDAGTYDVSLTISNDLSNHTMMSSITVIDGVVASFTHNGPVLEGNEISFTNNATGGGTMTYMWDFDDGNTSDEANPSHTYTSAGIYDVSLTVSNEVSTETTNQSVEITQTPTAVTLNNLSTQQNEQSMILLWGLASLLAMGTALTRIRAMHQKQLATRQQSTDCCALTAS